MRLGIIGGGQLGAMLAEAGNPLGVTSRVLDPQPASCVRRVADCIEAEYDEPRALSELSDWAQILTYEFENVPLDAVQGRPDVVPPPEALHIAQDRLHEKTFFQEHGVGTAPFAPVSRVQDLQEALVQVGTPAILKTRRLGYDGKGQALVNNVEEARAAFEELGGVPCILEGVVDFRRELSVIAVRARNGDVRVYPLAENHHRGGILRWSITPAPNLGDRQDEAASIAVRLLEALDYVGVLTVELFDVDGPLVANEMAPRVHNSGHHTIEGAVTSQFENHVRAVLDLPLGSTDVLLPVGMVNLIGAEPPLEALLAIEGVSVHRYVKAPRPGRKVGHVAVQGPDRTTVEQRLARVRELVAEHEQ